MTKLERFFLNKWLRKLIFSTIYLSYCSTKFTIQFSYRSTKFTIQFSYRSTKFSIQFHYHWQNSRFNSATVWQNQFSSLIVQELYSRINSMIVQQPSWSYSTIVWQNQPSFSVQQWQNLSLSCDCSTKLVILFHNNSTKLSL